MKIQLITPEKFQWLKGYKESLKGHAVLICPKPVFDSTANVMVFLWCNQDTVQFINESAKLCRYIVYVRRYELFSGMCHKLDWSKVDAIVFVNDVLKDLFTETIGKVHKDKTHLIYNSVSLEDWTFKERGHGKNIAMVGWVNQKKNFPLAVQIMAELPRDYVLHVAGGIQCDATALYLSHMCQTLGIDIRLHGRQENINEWLEDKNYLLSCAISEGCPNNVVEAMAKGIRPIIHNWPGAEKQFGQQFFGPVFDTVEHALGLILSSVPVYDSIKYRHLVETKFGPSNFGRFRNLVDEVANA